MTALTDDAANQGTFWTGGLPLGEHATWVFEGEEGLTRLSGPAAFSAPEPIRFRARLTRVQLDHVALEAFGASVHTAERNDRHVLTHPTPVLTFVLLAEGRLHVDTEHRSFDLESGGCLIVDSRETVTYTTETDVRMMRSMIGVEHIPRGLRDHGTDLDGPVARTPLVDGFIAFVSNILRASAAGRPTEGGHLVRAVAELQVAVLAEIQEAATRSTAAVTLQRRIEDYIDGHLADPELGPRTIATALGISLRHAHGSFNEQDRTIGRVIRERRLEAVATELQTSRSVSRTEDLAIRFGFQNATSLQRAFRMRFGASLAEHRRTGHRSLG